MPALITWIIGLVVFLFATYFRKPQPAIAKLGYAAFCIGLAIWLYQGAKLQ